MTAFLDGALGLRPIGLPQPEWVREIEAAPATTEIFIGAPVALSSAGLLEPYTPAETALPYGVAMGHADAACGADNKILVNCDPDQLYEVTFTGTWNPIYALELYYPIVPLEDDDGPVEGSNGHSIGYINLANGAATADGNSFLKVIGITDYIGGSTTAGKVIVKFHTLLHSISLADAPADTS